MNENDLLLLLMSVLQGETGNGVLEDGTLPGHRQGVPQDMRTQVAGNALGNMDDQRRIDLLHRAYQMQNSQQAGGGPRPMPGAGGPPNPGGAPAQTPRQGQQMRRSGGMPLIELLQQALRQ